MQQSFWEIIWYYLEVKDIAIPLLEMYSIEILVKELFQVKYVRECLLQHCLQCKHIQSHLFIINKATEEIMAYLYCGILCNF